MKWIEKNIWWTSFVGVFAIGGVGILAYCYAKDGYTLKSITLSDWLNYFASCGTIGGFLYLILDKILGEKEANHLRWQSQIPFVTLASPCDPTANYCDINILTFEPDSTGRGNGYFSICNLSKTNAYDIRILFYTKDSFIESNVFNRHYIPYLPPLMLNRYESTYSYQEYVYSNYNVNPDTKEVSNAKFEICSCLTDCAFSDVGRDEKIFFARIEYYSSLSKKHRYKIVSTFKVRVVCSSDSALEKSVKIKGINFLNYDYEE